MKKITTLLMGLLLSVATHAQHHTEEADHSTHTDAHQSKHKLALYGGFTHIDAAFYEHETHEESTGKWVPTLGIDYFYTLSKKFDVGFIGDVELDSYYIKHDNNSDLERNNVLVLTPVGKFKATHALGLILGAGVEVEYGSHVKYMAVVKAAVEYEVPITNGWEMAPSIAFDYKEEYSTIAFGMSLGKRF